MTCIFKNIQNLKKIKREERSKILDQFEIDFQSKHKEQIIKIRKDCEKKGHKWVDDNVHPYNFQGNVKYEHCSACLLKKYIDLDDNSISYSSMEKI